MTIFVDIHEAETHLCRLLEQVAKGERVVISNAGQPMADLVQHRCTPVVIGGLQGRFVYDDETFDDVDPDIQRTFYGDDAAAP